MRKSLLVLTLAAVAALAATKATAYFRPELMGTRIVKASELRPISGQEGTQTLYFQAPTSTLLNLGVRRVTIAPGATPHPARPHSQVTEAVLVVEGGMLDVQLEEGGPIEKLEAGSAIFLAPNQWHTLRNGGDAPATFLETTWTSPGMNGEPDYLENAVNWRIPRPPRQ